MQDNTQDMWFVQTVHYICSCFRELSMERKMELFKFLDTAKLMGMEQCQPNNVIYLHTQRKGRLNNEQSR